jgi:signal transduction histidine kinase/ligand-binding sensor protein
LPFVTAYRFYSEGTVLFWKGACVATQSSTLDFNSVNIGQIIDLPALQAMMDDLYDVTKIGFSLIDLKGNVLVATGRQDICVNFHRKNSQTLKNCLESDLQLTEGVKEGEYRVFNCTNGLVEIVTPLCIGGKHVANIFSGQFLFKGEDDCFEWFVGQAEKYGFDKEAYLCAFKIAPRLERGKVECLMEFYTKLSKMISKKGFANLKLAALLEEENKIQQELKTSREDLNRAQAVAKTGSWRVNVQGNLLWSDETYRIFGVPLGTPMTYEGFLKLVHPDDCKYVDAQWQGALLGKPYDVAFRILVDRQTRWVHERAELEFDKTGKLFWGSGTIQDVTEHELMRQSLEKYNGTLEALVDERKKQLQDAERIAAIGQTAGMVGHDIRNPLQAIASDVYLLKSDLAAVSDSKIKHSIYDSLEGIEANVHYINKIVADLQDYARTLKPHLYETDLKMILDDLLAQNGLPENVEASVKVDDSAGSVLVDPAFVARILFNLVTNAVQAMPEGGKLTIRAYKEANDAVITVEDTGVGIPKKFESKLFTPMFTTKSKGQGFGLVVVKRLTDALGGTVTFESQEGQGTTFMVRLPQHKKS